MPRSFHGIEGYRKEPVLGSSMYRSQVDGNKIYDLEKDKMGLYPSDAELKKKGYSQYDERARLNLYEQKMLKAGFDGAYSGTHKVVMMFKPVDAEPVKYKDKALPSFMAREKEEELKQEEKNDKGRILGKNKEAGVPRTDTGTGVVGTASGREYHRTYPEAARAEGNPWVRLTDEPTNKGRTLMVQFTSDLMGESRF